MVIVPVKIEREQNAIYMDGRLYEDLQKYVIPSVKKKDFDYVLAIDGQEGGGKSVFAMQIAKVLDPSFCLDRITFTPDEFKEAITNAKPHSCVIYDEAFTGFSSRTSLSTINNMLVSMMMQMRAKNLFVLLVLPSFFMLDKYCVLHRCKGLFHVYLNDGKRGYWKFYSKDRIKLLYLKGKKLLTYKGVKAIFFGRFADKYTVDEKKYRAKKQKALTNAETKKKIDDFKVQRNTLFMMIYENFEKNIKNISRLCKLYGWKIDRSTISKVLSNYDIKHKLEDESTPKNNN